jgi:hypothetical protein
MTSMLRLVDLIAPDGRRWRRHVREAPHQPTEVSGAAQRADAAAAARRHASDFAADAHGQRAVRAATPGSAFGPLATPKSADSKGISGPASGRRSRLFTRIRRHFTPPHPSRATCHAEGRGFESLQPLCQKARFCGPFVFLKAGATCRAPDRGGPGSAFGPLSVRVTGYAGAGSRVPQAPGRTSPDSEGLGGTGRRPWLRASGQSAQSTPV